MLGRTDEVEILALYFIHHVFHLVEAHDARHDIAVNHVRRNDIGKALVDHEIARVGEYGRMEPRDIPRQVIEPLSRGAAGGIDVDAVELFQNVEMIRDLEIGHLRLAEPLELDVFAVVPAYGHVGRDDVGYGHHVLFQIPFDLRGFRFDGRETLRVRDDLRLDFFGFLFIALLHQHADLFGKGVSGGAQSIAFGDQRAALRIELRHLIYERELFVLKLLFDVFLYQIGICSDKIDIDHNLLPLRCSASYYTTFPVQKQLNVTNTPQIPQKTCVLRTAMV